jgi:hypothetical protein
MKRIRIVGLCLVAAFAMSAVAAGTASATIPEFLTKAVVGETAPTNIPLSGTVGVAVLETVAKNKVECKDAAGTAISGTVTSKNTTAKNVTKFTECKSGEFVCENAGAGIIETKPLEGELGPITASLPGIRLWAEGNKGGVLASFTCAGGAIKIEVRGTITGSLGGSAGSDEFTGKLLPTGSLTFSQSAGTQKYQGFEGGEKGQLESNLNGGAFEKAGQSVVAKLKTVPSTLELGVTK